MPTLYIRFVSGKGWDSRLIEWYSRCEWSHVEFLESSWSSWTFGAQLHGGIRYRTLNDACYARAAKYEIWEIPITDAQFAQYSDLKSDALKALYDWPAILSFILGPHRLHLSGAWICSGFVAMVLDSLNLLEAQFAWEMYDPRDIWMLIPQIPGAKKVVDTAG